MTSRNELYKMMAGAIIRDGQLDEQSSIGHGPNGDMFIRLRDQVFKITADEINQISQHPQAMEQAEAFMKTLPHKYGRR